MRHPEASEVVNKDAISHFVLRLVCYRTEDSRKWFLSMETALFRYRFRLESSEAQRALMAEFDLPCKAVSSAEFEGVGLKLEDALAFWKAEFSQKDYTPYSCQKTISLSPGVGDHHGYPFRHFSEENLRAALGRMGVGSQAMEDEMDKVRNRHCQLACTLTFEAVHGSSCDMLGLIFQTNTSVTARRY